MKKLVNAKELYDLRDTLIREMTSDQRCVRICMTGCRASGAVQVKEAFHREVEKSPL